MRTLVVSDLHLGAGGGRAALEDPATLRVLTAAVARTDRLVLLGDVVELRERPLVDALAAASRVLPQLAAALPSGSELILVPGNHDHELITHADAMAAVLKLLSSADVTVRVEYPGVWLRADVYAQHGHYLDRHTHTPAFERLAAGVMARMIGLPLARMRGAQDYERVLTPIYAWMYVLAQNGDGASDGGEGDRSMRLLRRIREGGALEAFALRTGVRGLVATLSRAGLGPLSGDLGDRQLRRASLVAYGEVLTTLGLEPAYALFGHTHRAGPLAGDDPAEWETRAGTRMINSGCWLRDRPFATAVGPSPYRAGFAVALDGAGPPRLVNLLDA